MYGRSLYAWRRAQLIARIPADTSPTPTIASCSPATTPSTGSGAITITGTGFMSKYGIVYVDTVLFDTLPASFSVTSPTTIVAVAPAHAAGAVCVIVKGSGGSISKASAVTYTAGAAPVVSAIAPNLGLTAGGTSVTITVNDSTGCSSATVGGLAITGFAIVDGTHVSGITAAHAAGATDVTVTNMTGTSSPLVGAFTYGVVPAASAITPAVGLTAGGTAVSITVANSAGCTGATVGGVAITSFAIADGTHVTGSTGAHAAGATDVLVTNAFGTSPALVGAFTYGVAPAVSSITPTQGDTAGGGQLVTITGTNLTGATGVTIGGTAATSITVVNATTITCLIGAHAAATGQSVLVTTAFGTNGANALFEYWSPASVGTPRARYRADLGVTNVAGKASVWVDQSGAGDSNRNASQSTAGNRPTINATDANFGNQATLTFATASTSFMDTGVFTGGTYAQPLIIFFVARWTSQGFLYLFDDTNGASRVAFLDNGPGVDLFAGASITNGALSNAVTHAGVLVVNGASSAVYIDSSSPAAVTGDASTSALNSIRIGAFNGGGNGFDGTIAELAFCSASDTLANRQKFMKYCNQRYGTSFT